MKENFIDITRKRYDAMVTNGLSKEVIIAKLGFSKVKVTYGIKAKKNMVEKIFGKPDIKVFELHEWFLYREGIVTNLYNKGLIKVEFLNEV